MALTRLKVLPNSVVVVLLVELGFWMMVVIVAVYEQTKGMPWVL